MKRLTKNPSYIYLSYDTQVVGTDIRDWLALLKPRVVSLVIFIAFCGIVTVPELPDFMTGLTILICICLASGAAGAINMWYERDIDAIMIRTASRPIPGGRIEPEQALYYGITLASVAVVLLAVVSNIAATVMLALSIFFYVVVYTIWLKRRTPQNIVIGGVAGSLPPLIGWTAVTGSLAPLPIIMFAIVFFWTPPHFWSLSLFACKDYKRAGIPMLPVLRGQRYTCQQVLLYTLVLVITSFLPLILGLSGWVYGGAAFILNGLFLYYVYRMFLEQCDNSGKSVKKEEAARTTFLFSIIYLFVLFTTLTLDHLMVSLIGIS